jgi:hypothetical protein
MLAPLSAPKRFVVIAYRQISTTRGHICEHGHQIRPKLIPGHAPSRARSRRLRKRHFSALPARYPGKFPGMGSHHLAFWAAGLLDYYIP